jgi:hypothetical protein
MITVDAVVARKCPAGTAALIVNATLAVPLSQHTVGAITNWVVEKMARINKMFDEAVGKRLTARLSVEVVVK